MSSRGTERFRLFVDYLEAKHDASIPDDVYEKRMSEYLAFDQASRDLSRRYQAQMKDAEANDDDEEGSESEEETDDEDDDYVLDDFVVADDDDDDEETEDEETEDEDTEDEEDGKLEAKSGSSRDSKSKSKSKSQKTSRSGRS